MNFVDYVLDFRPDTFVYTTADNTGFLLPQNGAYFVVGNDGEWNTNFVYFKRK